VQAFFEGLRPARNGLRLRFDIALPSSLLERFRLLFLALAAIGALTEAVTILVGGELTATSLAAVAATLALAGYWVAGYRRGGFPIALEPVEAGVLLVGLHFAPGAPFLPLFGLCFRSMYGNLALAVARYLMWMGALFVAHAGRGTDMLQADIARAVGTALAPFLFQALAVALRASAAGRRRLTSLVQNSTDVITIVGEDLRVRWQAESIRGVLGHEPGMLVGLSILALVHPDDHERLSRCFGAADGPPDAPRRVTLRLRHGDGAYRCFDVVVARRLHDPSVDGFVLNMRDATDRDQLERELRAVAAEREHEAMHDPLTGLANRRRLFIRLEEAIEVARAQDDELALLLIDLDHFKELNDTLGHHTGDRLLREIGPRLIACVRDADLVARIGGDEFVVLLPAGVAVAAAEEVAGRLRHTIEQPFRIDELTLLVRASVGIAMYPEHGRDSETLVRRADVAMYSAKSRGIGHEVYVATRDGHSRARLALVGELPAAIESGEIVVHFQPKFDLQSGALDSAEALVRWEHPQLGRLGPGAFLPLAEQTGLMRALTLRVLDEALAQCARWRAEGLDLTVAVNLGTANLLDAGLPVDVVTLLADHGVDPSRLQLEITETIVAADPVRVIAIMNRLRALGVTLSLDDFGTGSSSLAYLRELPVQELKIDKSFILGLEDDPQAATIVQTIVELGHNLGLRCVGEGIETEHVYRLLADLGCDYGQGFLMGRPMPAGELTALARGEPAGLPAAPAAR
jgi:diguanylate cyclase (GGDEF)-like protein/PAS domain S-box-containing protein